MSKGRLLYAQSGGVTAVINTTAAAVIETARAHGVKPLAARNGILGALREDLIDAAKISKGNLASLHHTPGGAFGSCRYKLGDPGERRAEYQRLIDVFRAHDIRHFLYNGGNDSADTALKVSQVARSLGHDLNCIGVPKTVDNDLAVTDCCPGFGSVAKYTALAVREASLDVASMADTSTRVFVIEVMGRHAGWIAAAAGLAGEDRDAAPHVILFPERTFDRQAFLDKVQATVERVGFCTVVASEGIRDADSRFLAESGTQDAFGHVQLGGTAPVLAGMVQDALRLKCHWSVPDYLQRSARHVASKVDVEQAAAVGKAAVEYALAGKNGMMPVIVRTSDTPYRWRIEPVALKRIAHREKKMPAGFIRRDGYGITAAARRYLSPLIRGEAAPPYGRDGLPKYVTLKHVILEKKLPSWSPA